MKQLIVVIGVGGIWPTIARKTAHEANRMTGIQAAALVEDPIGVVNPSWLKCRLLDIFPGYDRYWAWDADLFPLGESNLGRIGRALPPDAFAGCPDRPSNAVAMECENYKLDPSRYINCGLISFTEHHRPVLEMAWRGHPRFGSWLEQTAINNAIAQTNTNLQILPPALNKLWVWHEDGDLSFPQWRASGIKGIHLVEWGNKTDTLERIQTTVFATNPEPPTK